MDSATLRRYVQDRHAFRREQIVLPTGTTLGAVEEPWQTEHVFQALDARDEQGDPRYRMVYLELPRGHAKTATLAAEALTAAFLDGDIRIYFAAGDKGQARIAFDMLRGFIRRNPALAASFRMVKDELEVTSTGARIEVLSSDAPTTYGLGGLSRRLLILADELWVWQGRELWDALYSAVPKALDWRVIVGSNAGFDTTSVAWELRELCRKQVDPRFYLYSPEGTVAGWISERDLETQRRSLPAQVYQRLYENRWTEGAGAFITREELEACIDPGWRPQLQGQPHQAYVVGLDLGLVHDRSARVVVHYDRQLGQVVMDDLKVWQGSRAAPVSIAAVEEDLVAVTQRFPHAKVYCDPWQFQGSLQRLRGLRVEEFKFTGESVRQLSENLLSLIKAGQLRLYPDVELERELLRLEVKQTAYGWRVDHQSSGYSDRAMALGVACLRAVVRSSAANALEYLHAQVDHLGPRSSELKEHPRVVPA